MPVGIGTHAMKIPFTAEQFFGVFAKYNHAVWPAEPILITLAVLMVLAARSGIGSRGITAVLAIFWVWMGAVYHIVFFSAINSAAVIFGGLFILQALLLFGYGTLTTQLRFDGARDAVRNAAGWVMIAYALVAYPIIGYLAGQRYPALPTFGLPCPTTIFTLGMFAWASSLPLGLLVIPVVWAAIATSAAMSLGVVEDYALPVAALVLVALTVRERMARRVSPGGIPA